MSEVFPCGKRQHSYNSQRESSVDLLSKKSEAGSGRLTKAIVNRNASPATSPVCQGEDVQCTTTLAELFLRDKEGAAFSMPLHGGEKKKEKRLEFQHVNLS